MLEIKKRDELHSDQPDGRGKPTCKDGGSLVFRPPRSEDGPQVSQLIAASPPLDVNSAYCNLLQCSDFADTCIIAERRDEVLGWISGYVKPVEPECLFIWQVAVAAEGRGEGLAGRMLDELVRRPALNGCSTLSSTITKDNAASWALFESFARRHGAQLHRSPRFERERHFTGAHETEWEVRIAPLTNPSQ